MKVLMFLTLVVLAAGVPAAGGSSAENSADGRWWVHTRDIEGVETQARALHAASITDSKTEGHCQSGQL